MREKLGKWLKKLIKTGIFLGAAGLLLILCINSYVKSYAKKYILTEEKASELEDVDCVLVLGCLVRPGGVPSQMLKDRVDQGIRLYENQVSDRLLMSGDHGRKDYDEVNTMKRIAAETGIPSGHVFMDHAGFSTYESMYRAKEVFQVKKAVIVTQGYHLYRAVYDARKLGIEAYGVASDPRRYGGQKYRDAREVLARTKDFFVTIWKQKPTYLGDAIPVSGDGDLTND